jgi:hypothetical protein
MGVRSPLFHAFGTDAMFDGFGGGKHSPAPAASSFVLYGVTVRGDFFIRDFQDSPSYDFDGGSIFFEFGFAGEYHCFLLRDIHTQVSEIWSVIGSGKERYKERGIFLMFDLEGVMFSFRVRDSEDSSPSLEELRGGYPISNIHKMSPG